MTGIDPEQRKRVLHVINGEHYAGAERVQDLLADELPEHGYEVGFACLKPGIFPDKRHSSRAPLYALPMSSGRDFRVVLELARLVRKENYRLIHTHTVRGAMVGQVAATLTGVPMVHHVHSPSARDTESTWRNHRNAFVERASLVRARRLITVSDSLRHYLVSRGYGEKRIRVVCNGVPMLEKTRAPLCRGETLTLGTVALFRPRKGLEVLLDALGHLRKTGMDVRLLAIGPFETEGYEASVRLKLQRDGLEDHVTFVGFTQTVAAHFRQMHVFVLPSLFGEGMPMVVLEAMAAGLPVISTQVEGIPEVIHDGREGLLVEPGSASQLASAIARIGNGDVDAGRMGDAARCRQQSVYSTRAMAAGVASVYDEMFKPGGLAA
ncbi:MAG: glycosyltransferase family 4 protein [Woeseia sp.]